MTHPVRVRLGIVLTERLARVRSRVKTCHVPSNNAGSLTLLTEMVTILAIQIATQTALAAVALTHALAFVVLYCPGVKFAPLMVL
jgi:hypothetical protein